MSSENAKAHDTQQPATSQPVTALGSGMGIPIPLAASTGQAAGSSSDWSMLMLQRSFYHSRTMALVSRAKVTSDFFFQLQNDSYTNYIGVS